MKNYSIVCRGDEISKKLEEKIKNALNPYLTYNQEKPDLVIAIGGDGTVLHSVYLYQKKLDKVAFVGIHTGTLGFFTDYQKEEVDLLIEDILHKELTIEKRDMLEVVYQNKSYFALNEMRLENNRRSQVIDVEIDGEKLETFRGNGVCISTSSGSTAYNKSIQGAVMAPGVRGMQLSEIAGINHNAYRSLGASLIVTKKQTIKLHTLNYDYTVLCVDLQTFELSKNEEIYVKVAKKQAQFASYRQVSFIERLKKAFL